MYADLRVLDGEPIDQLAPHVPVTVEVLADLDPLAICKISQALALANELPTSFACLLRPDGSLHASAVLKDVPLRTVDAIHRKLTQLTCIISVAVASSSAGGVEQCASSS
jgi:hypothetical protein